ncbi:hypothetical protein WICANDRAFT_60109 [Wickerhamomyces anomalus NRRL Y-366-8]|uniref:SANT domain-containing protein n=1 Tax=Wickerhamomyces anomalus (strain ATCC 58044 / CBS 1984 / NCYC 433 / NRRL Y-366-8) TaxID=683960 RepID=A0A1E3P9F2_WICAA|nr:uncharacterized protein WICANDRAFT_60109 [Wickerhamomyces anomalus NRRL Y-366-8]ODQ62039.1 hypothetical protein WICANDRAFT_60109 [Wickerhamomyces anomalus NRRL Y-366-8]
MSADRNVRSQYPHRWGSSGSSGDRDDKQQQQSSSYQRHRQLSGASSSSNYHVPQSNRSSRDSYTGSGTGSGSYYDYSYKSNRPYYQPHSYRHQSRPNKSSDSYVGYHRNSKGSENPSSLSERIDSSTSNGFKSNKPNGFASGYDSYYERRNQRYSGSAEYRRNPEEKSDHYYPQRDRRTSLISSSSSTKPNRLQKSDERSVSPLNSDPYSEPPKLTEGYQRKSRPSLIPSNFKDDDNQNDEEDDDYELESALKHIPKPAIRQDTQDDKETKDETESSKEPSSGIQDRISEKIPLTLEHKEELDEQKGTLTRQSSEDSTYEPEQSLKDDKVIKDEKKPSDVNLDDKMDVDQPTRDEESDNYEPEIDVVETEHENSEPSPIPQEKEEHDEVLEDKSEEEPKLPIDEEQVKVEPKKKKITEGKLIVPLEKIDGCIFPMSKTQLRVWELKNISREDIIEVSPYLLKRPIKNLEDYPFYSRNLLVHQQGFKLKLMEKLSVLKGSTFDHKISLWNEYSQRSDDWNERCDEMDAQLRDLYPSQEIESEEQSQQPEPEPEHHQSSTRRGGRYHGDTVRSEAEFLEILKNLEKEKESDPFYKAELLAAKIPDMILNPVEKNLKRLDVNNLVLDKEEWAKRINTDGVDNFSKHEHELFCEAFLSNPKKFGRISAAMGGLRTPQECVLHYYKTKKLLTDYKQLVASKKKKYRKGKGNRRISKSKNATATNTSAPNTPSVETPADSGGEEKELALENFIPKEVVAEEFYTETGRRRRAAAPVFDSSKGAKNPNEQDNVDGAKGEDERKRALENNSPNETQDEDAKSNGAKHPPKKKARGPKLKKKEEVKIDNITPPAIETEEGRNGGRVITSYWSVRDINYFATLIGEFGTQWALISERMKTKSTTMVRNYYLKNADSHGWRSIAEAADKKNESYPHYPQNLVNNPSEPQVLKRPPLGVFSSHGDLPSNVNVSTTVKHEPSALPSVKNLAPFSQSVVPLQPLFQPQSQPQPQPPQSHLPSIGGSNSRSNPFSITSLLNPSEESKPSLPNPNPIPETSNRGSLLPTFNEQRDVYASYRNPASNGNGGSSVLSILNKEEPKPFNPLSTLVAVAAGNNNSTWNSPSTTGQNLPNLGGNKFDYNRDNLPQPSMYQFNGPFSDGNKFQQPENPSSTAGLPSNFRNILLPNAGQPDQNNGMRNDNNNNNNASFL